MKKSSFYSCTVPSSLLHIILFLLYLTPQSSCSSASDNGKEKTTTATSPPPSGVISLDARSFDSSIRDGNAWLIEFYAPWCSHCQRFSATYERVAKTLHSANDDDEKENVRKIRVAKVDGSTERALASRFSIRGFPSFFLVDGWTVRQYEGVRSLDALVKFANETYVDVEPIPFLNSPFGPVGQSRALLMYSGTRMVDLHAWLVEKGLSKVTAAGVLAFGGITVSLILVIITGLLIIPKAKID